MKKVRPINTSSNPKKNKEMRRLRNQPQKSVPNPEGNRKQRRFEKAAKRLTPFREKMRKISMNKMKERDERAINIANHIIKIQERKAKRLKK